MAIHDRSILRLLDANLNRSTEGLRVLEECARMLLNNVTITGTAKELRHDLTNIFRDNPVLDLSLPLVRNTETDVLKSGTTSSENSRSDLTSLIRANAGRAAEAVRALEEYGKLISPESAARFKDIRFRIYDLEQLLLGALFRESLLKPERLRFGLSICLDSLSVPISQVVKTVHDAGCGLIVITGSSQSDYVFAESVREIVSLSNRLMTVLVDKRIDIALDGNADGVVLNENTIIPDRCRKLGGHGLVIAYRTTDHFFPEQETSREIDILLVEVPINTGRSIFHTGGRKIPIIASLGEKFSELHIPFDSGFDGYMFPFPGINIDNPDNALSRFRKALDSLYAAL